MKPMKYKTNPHDFVQDHVIALLLTLNKLINGSLQIGVFMFEIIVKAIADGND